MVAITLGVVFNCMMMFYCPGWLYSLMQLSPMSTPFKSTLVLIAAFHLMVGAVGEQKLLPVMARGVGRLRRILTRGSEKVRKKYKVMSEEMKVQDV